MFSWVILFPFNKYNVRLNYKREAKNNLFENLSSREKNWYRAGLDIMGG